MTTKEQTLLQVNIRNIYNQATDKELRKGRQWYEQAQLVCHGLAAKHGVSYIKVAAVLAATSPQTDWYSNQRITDKVLEGQREGLHTRDVMVKCDAILSLPDDEALLYECGDVVYGKKGWKTSAFFFNIMGYENHVTIDRHALNLATLDDYDWKWMTPRRYEALSAAYQTVAAELGIKGYELQAITWLVWRRLLGHTEHLEYVTSA